MRLPTFFALASSALVAAATWAAAPASVPELAAKSIQYLRAKQDPATGGWSVPASGPVYPAITALVINGMLMEPGASPADPAIARGVDFLLKYQQPDGGIYDKVLPSYNTAISISALSRVNTPAAKEAVKKGVEFLRRVQWAEDSFTTGPAASDTRPVDPKHPFYGGVGYGSRGRPDLSNLGFFVQALHDAGVGDDDPAMKRALVFLQRIQMDERFNDQDYAKGSSQGGFAYATAVNKDTAGQGQSFAGEIAESLSGPPGSVAIVTFKPMGGKTVTVDKSELQKLLAPHIAKASPGAEDAPQVLLGPTADGKAASRLEVRAPINDPEALKTLIAAALKEKESTWGTPEITAQPAEHWRGVSRLRAYGSMTYVGFKSYVYAGLRRDDPRVVAARQWIARNYTLAENPGMGKEGQYYYYLVFGRAMNAWGEPTIDVAGTPRNWRADLAAQLATLQKPDGSFTSVHDRWMENNDVLITAYSLLALQNARE